MTYVDVPPKAAILHALEVLARRRQQPIFADMFNPPMATLPDERKKAVEGQDRGARTPSRQNSAGQLLRKGYREVTDCAREPSGARHPLVRTDPATGRKAAVPRAGWPSSYRRGHERCRQRSAARCVVGAWATQEAVRHGWP